MLTYRQLIAQLQDRVATDPELATKPVPLIDAGLGHLPAYGVSHVATSVYGFGMVILTPWKEQP